MGVTMIQTILSLDLKVEIFIQLISGVLLCKFDFDFECTERAHLKITFIFTHLFLNV